MEERSKVKIKVVSQTGVCRNGHKVGDEWVIEGTTPGGMCPSAWHACWPNVRVLMLGGSFNWRDNPEVLVEACPDADNPVLFEVRRLHE